VDVLLAALLQAVTQWSEGCWLAAKVLNFGRGAIPGADDMDLSRTVGQIAFAGYVLLEREESDGPEEMLKSVREQLRRLPNQGLGYRSLFLLDQDAEAVEKVTSLCYDQVNVFFNYLGQMEGYSEAGLFRRARESTGATQNSQNKDETGLLLWCTLLVRGGRLIVSLDYYTNVHKRTTIEAVVDGFLEALRASIASCRSPTAKPTP
jgi:non-ribosomal peptide synthase protein (TIGR01720 family)